MATVRLGRYEAEDYELPNVCMQCGAKAVGYRRRGFRWSPGWVIITALFGLLPYFLITELTMRRMAVWVPYCKAHKKGPLWPTLVSVGSLVALIAVTAGLIALLNDEGAGAVAIVFCAGVFAFIVWMFVAIILHTPTIRPTEINDKSITLKGVCQEFIDALNADRRGEDRPQRAHRRDEEERPRARRRAADEDGGYYDPETRKKRRARSDASEEGDDRR
jgi:hypothetical protein